MNTGVKITVRWLMIAINWLNEKLHKVYPHFSGSLMFPIHQNTLLHLNSQLGHSFENISLQFLTLSSLAAILSQWALVVSTPSYSAVIFAVRNLVRCPLNHLKGFFFFFFFFLRVQTNVVWGVCQTPYNWKGLAGIHLFLSCYWMIQCDVEFLLLKDW